MRRKDIQWRDVVLPLAGWLWAVSWGFYILHGWVLGELFAIGDSANPTPPPYLALTSRVLGFPMFHLWFPVAQWLKPYLPVPSVMELFVCINAVVWARMVKWFLGLP
jgi:hypothetical protein